MTFHNEIQTLTPLESESMHTHAHTQRWEWGAAWNTVLSSSLPPSNALRGSVIYEVCLVTLPAEKANLWRAPVTRSSRGRMMGPACGSCTSPGPHTKRVFHLFSWFRRTDEKCCSGVDVRMHHLGDAHWCEPGLIPDILPRQAYILSIRGNDRLIFRR